MYITSPRAPRFKHPPARRPWPRNIPTFVRSREWRRVQNTTAAAAARRAQSACRYRGEEGQGGILADKWKGGEETRMGRSTRSTLAELRGIRWREIYRDLQIMRLCFKPSSSNLRFLLSLPSSGTTLRFQGSSRWWVSRRDSIFWDGRKFWKRGIPPLRLFFGKLWRIERKNAGILEFVRFLRNSQRTISRIFSFLFCKDLEDENIEYWINFCKTFV